MNYCAFIRNKEFYLRSRSESLINKRESERNWKTNLFFDIYKKGNTISEKGNTFLTKGNTFMKKGTPISEKGTPYPTK